MGNQGESDHELAFLETSEILEILEISPVKDPFVMTSLSVPEFDVFWVSPSQERGKGGGVGSRVGFFENRRQGGTGFIRGVEAEGGWRPGGRLRGGGGGLILVRRPEFPAREARHASARCAQCEVALDKPFQELGPTKETCGGALEVV